MGQALSPALALDYVRELSADVRAAIVLDGTGRLLGGPPQLVEPACALLVAGGDAAELEVVAGDGVVCAVRSPGGRAAVAVCGRFAIAGVVRQDLRAALAALEGRPPDSDRSLASRSPLEQAQPELAAADCDANHDFALQRAAEAMISAVQRGFDR